MKKTESKWFLLSLVLSAGLCLSMWVPARAQPDGGARTLGRRLNRVRVNAPALLSLRAQSDEDGDELKGAGLSQETVPALVRSGSGEKPVESKRTNGMVVVLASDSGKLTGGENAICVLFQDIATGGPADVQDVKLKFTLRVGRNPGEPIAAQLNRDGPGRYCGHVNLGLQYYDPATYYVEMRYADTTGKKRKLSFWATVK